MNQVSTAARGTAGEHPRIAPRPPAYSIPSQTPHALVLGSAIGTGNVTERYEDAFVAAVRLYERGSWARAFEQLAKLADGGNAPAAKLALLMLRYGDSLYQTKFNVPPAQVAKWARVVLRYSPRLAGIHA